MTIADVALVACVKTKADRLLPAKDLYISPWFRMARRYAEQHARRWFILSAHYGLVHPEHQIRPYEYTMAKMGRTARELWTEAVEIDMRREGVSGRQVLVLAGMAYRDPLYPYLMKNFDRMDIPMAGMMMGQQLSWLSKET